MRSEALELALALYRAPAQRHALRAMGLPHDIGLLIQLASAPQPLLQETATRLGETESIVLDASRFYLQQALFYPDATAYRVLGLASDATPERIREHYRLLQRWLHPDRRGEDWEALLATRVNWAWGQLRNEAARSAYDREHEQDEAAGTEPSQAGEPRPLGEWRPMPDVHERGSWMKRIALTASFCACLALLYLAMTRDDTAMQDEFAARIAPMPSDSAKAERQVAASTLAAPVDQPAPVDAPLRPPESATPPASADSPLPQSVVAQPEVRSEIPEAAPQAPALEIAASSNPLARADGDALHANARAADTQPAPPSSGQASSADKVAQASPAPPPPKLAVAAATRADVAAPVAQAAPVLAPAARPLPPPLPPQGREIAQAVRTGPSSVPAASHPSSPAIATPPKTSMGRSVPAHAPERIAQSAAPAATQSASDTVAVAPTRDDAPPRPVNAEAEKAAATETLVRATLARARVQELSAFFGDTGSKSPPVWNDVGGQANAERLRSALHTRAKLRDADFAVDDPVWRLSEDTASLNADYQLRRGRTVSESGRFSLGMVWREKMWLVTSVELQPSP